MPARESPSPIARAVLRVLSRVFGLLGVVALLVSVLLAVLRAVEIAEHERTEGVVVALAYNMGSRPSARPVVEFTTPAGRTVRFTSLVGSRPPAFDVGERVPVTYPLDDPGDALIATFWATWFVPTLFALIGLPFLVVGVILFAVGRRAAGQPAADGYRMS